MNGVCQFDGSSSLLYVSGLATQPRLGLSAQTALAADDEGLMEGIRGSMEAASAFTKKSSIEDLIPFFRRRALNHVIDQLKSEARCCSARRNCRSVSGSLNYACHQLYWP